MSGDLISRSALMAEMGHRQGCGCSCADCEKINCLMGEVIEDAPTVDAVEVVHGRWERPEYHGFLRCSQCKDVYIDDSWVADGKWNYCPNCGAKMDGERKDNG